LRGTTRAFLSLATLSHPLGTQVNSLRMVAGSSTHGDLHCYQRHLDRLDLAAPPRVELTYGVAEPLGLTSVAVLDASFNPPTRAHLHMLDAAVERLGLSRTMLLLAKQNADKPVVGATLPQRLQMMTKIAVEREPAGTMVCGATAHPLFVDKAAALHALCGAGARIVLLVGFDTWVRVVDPKYYAPGGLDDALRQIFERVEVAVVSREPGSASNLEASMSVEEQERRVRSLPADVVRGRLHFLVNPPDVAGLSSSAIRKAVTMGDASATRAMLPECLLEYVEREGLYKD
jgi:nicotinic acid mononucleotide adenylyltransferase